MVLLFSPKVFHLSIYIVVKQKSAWFLGHPVSEVNRNHVGKS